MVRRFTVDIRFSFPAVLSLLLCTDREGTALMCMAACILHELGHILMMLYKRKPPRKITFYGGGILLSTDGLDSVPVLLCGCAANFLLSVVFFFFERTRLFGIINLLTGLINLLPIRPLDGGMLLERIFLRLMPPEKVAGAMTAVEAITGALLVPSVILLFYDGIVGISAVIFMIYLAAVEILEK